MSKPLDARTGITNPLGKCTESVETQIPTALLDALTVMQHIEGKGRSEILRDMLTTFLLGSVSNFPKQKRSVDQAITGLAFVAGLTNEEYIDRVLAAHVFGQLHVCNYGAVGTDAIPEKSPVIARRDAA